MPRFLEDETTFNKTYNKYLTGNIKKMQEKLEDTQSFINALKSLKRRIAPFILRRTKEDVLKELPPKVIQDYECIMPALQYSVHQVVERTMPYSQVVGKQTNSL
jgi:TATA-binding protein-associated factor